MGGPSGSGWGNQQCGGAQGSPEEGRELSALCSDQVEEHGEPGGCCKISLFFRSNPYFRNDVVVKEFLWHITGENGVVPRWVVKWSTSHSCL